MWQSSSSFPSRMHSLFNADISWLYQLKSCSVAKELNEVRNKKMKQVKIKNKMKNLKKKVEESEQLMHYMNLNSIVIKEA